MPSTALPALTVSHLLAYLCAAFLLQAALGIGMALRRRRLVTGAEGAEVLPQALSLPAVRAAWPGLRPLRVLRRQYEDALQTQCSFLLAPTDGLPLPLFRPGQFVTLTLALPAVAHPASQPANAAKLTRCYSLSDRPRSDVWRITVKRVPAPADRPDLLPGAASSWLHDHVHAGDVLQVKAPAGAFYLDADPAVPAPAGGSGVPVVLVAGGIGITPLMSMLRWCGAEEPERPVHLFYGVRHGGEHAFKTLLAQLAAEQPTFHLTVAYSQPRADDVPGRDFTHAGRVDVALLRATLPAGRHVFYVCGPAPMMATLVPALRAWGVPAGDIHHEAFGPASVVPASPAAGASAARLSVQFRTSGRTLEWDGRDANLLALAERHGMAPEAGCRVGGCGTCETRLVSGRVVYAAPPAFAVSPGHCLLCVGTPATTLVLAA
jgi:ferredoxin-NADP reductase